MKQRNTIYILVTVFILLIGGWVVFNIFYNSRRDNGKFNTKTETSHDVSVVYVNAGRADSILVQLDGHSFLIDTGLKSSVTTIKEVLNKYKVGCLDAVFLTHQHSDHIGGLKKIAKDYEISKIYEAQLSIRDYKGKNEIDKVAEKLEIPIEQLKFENQVKLVDDVFFEVLGPIQLNLKDDNDNSLVLRMHVNGRTFIFSGDMQFAEEQTLMDNNVDVAADVYKISNHGNPDATLESFAKKVSPSYTIVTTDTQKDKDSANKRVLSFFKKSKIYLTQDYELGVLVTVNPLGKIKVEEA